MAEAKKSGAAASEAAASEKNYPMPEATSTDAPAARSSRSGGRAAAAPAAGGETAARAERGPALLKVHHLRPAAGAKKDRTRVGRGEGSKGKTAGRGGKGTKARYQVRPGLEGGNLNFVMRSPKLKGFKNPFRVEYQVVNLEKLAELYPTGGDVTIADLVAKGAVRKNEKVKILGTGEIAVSLTVAVDKVSESAQQKILAAGGSVA